MALQTINIGQFVNDGTGDDLRTAFEKVNANFNELNLLQGQNNTASNVGVGSGIFKEKIGVDLKFKSISAGNGVALSITSNEIVVTNVQSSISEVNADVGTINASSPGESITIAGGTNISTEVSGTTLTINSLTDLSTDLSPSLSADLNSNSFSINNVNEMTAKTITSTDFYGRFNGAFIGTLTGNQVGNSYGLLYDIDIREHNRLLTTFDFGTIFSTPSNTIELILSFLDVNMGTFTAPSFTSIDGGTIV